MMIVLLAGAAHGAEPPADPPPRPPIGVGVLGGRYSLGAQVEAPLRKTPQLSLLVSGRYAAFNMFSDPVGFLSPRITDGGSQGYPTLSFGGRVRTSLGPVEPWLGGGLDGLALVEATVGFIRAVNRDDGLTGLVLLMMLPYYPWELGAGVDLRVGPHLTVGGGVHLAPRLWSAGGSYFGEKQAPWWTVVLDPTAEVTVWF